MQKHVTVTISGDNLPESLRELHTAPKHLYVKGDQALLAAPKIVGIVGARKFTPYGREVTGLVARTLARANVPVVSGLALGVDSVAHRACVEMGSPTIAVLPCGIDTVYPASHRGIAEQILLKNGALISEYPDRTTPMRHQFIERNRIIAALSDILVITEAAENSGSLHTARFALELGKTIMVTPGNITSPYSAGTNSLLRMGAVPILRPEDVLDELGIVEPTEHAYIPENEIEHAILSTLDTAMSGDELLRASTLKPAEFQTHLTMLEIKGILYMSGGLWRKK